jgi:hypothetical protein
MPASPPVAQERDITTASIRRFAVILVRTGAIMSAWTVGSVSHEVFRQAPQRWPGHRATRRGRVMHRFWYTARVVGLDVGGGIEDQRTSREASHG